VGRYSIALHKHGPTCNPHNPCSGKYGKCLDLKLTNECNGKCPFCIESKGFSPETVLDSEELAKKINAQSIDSLLILGGEPLLYLDLIGLVSRIRKNVNIYITTNGSLLTPQIAKNLSSYVKCVNISIHHSTSARHQELTQISLDGPTLYKSVQALGPNKVRINCNLIKGYVDSKKEVDAMYDLVRRLRIKKIRFAELQRCPALFVDAGTLFDSVPKKPFEEGCEVSIPSKDLEVTLRLTCGIVDEKKDPVIDPQGRNQQTQIMYSDAAIYNNWVNSIDGCHG
jgi:molybdenum cofactor biosynthesis enzyme MoaA